MMKSEHTTFVHLLEKYQIILSPTVSPVINKKKCAAAGALVEEYNKICPRKTTIRKVFKKISNMKARLKEKNYKNLRRKMKLEYSDWERKFLDIWVGNDITVFPSKRKKHVYLKHEIEDNPPDLSNGSSEVRTQLDCNTPDGNNSATNKLSKTIIQPEKIRDSSYIEIKHEEDVTYGVEVKMESADSLFPQNLGVSTTISDSNSVHFLEADSESETDYGNEDYDDKYENMTLDELKRIALITQIKTIKEQKAAATAKKELKLYKLACLKRKHEV